MRRIIGPILALFGILAIIGVATGAAYTAGLNAATVTAVTATGTTTVVPVVAYGWGGAPWFGFGGFFMTLIGIFLIVALLRVAFGHGRRHGYGYGWGPGYGRGPGGWDRHSADGAPGGPGGPGGSGDPREAWIRGRLDEWHRAAHADPGTEPTTPDSSGPTGPTPGSTGPTAPPAAG